MGQYHTVCNLTKKEYINSHQIDNGAKLMEQMGWDGATANALFLLLACSNGRGGGDAPEHDLIGSWAGDKIAVIGDYTEKGDIEGVDTPAIYDVLDEDKKELSLELVYKNISKEVWDMMITSLDLSESVKHELNK